MIPLGNVSGHIKENANVLRRSLDLWIGRDESKAQPEVRKAANIAMATIDAMLAELHQARQQLVSEIRRADDAAAARVDGMLAESRARREAGGAR